KAMGDDEGRPLRSSDDRAVSARVPRDRRGSALAATRRLDRRVVRSRPDAVAGERAPLESTEADVIELRQNQARDVAAGEGEVGGLPDALELARHADVELGVGEQVSELPRLLASGRGQCARDGW